MSESYVQANGLRLAYEEFGDQRDLPRRHPHEVVQYENLVRIVGQLLKAMLHKISVIVAFEQDFGSGFLDRVVPAGEELRLLAY